MSQLRLKYQTIEFGNLDIHLCSLRNRQEFSDPNGDAERLNISSAAWPIFGLVWPSSIVLANVMDQFDTVDKRILEVGCGLGLSSILLNKQGCDITATDHHPSVGDFLERNTALNSDASIPFERTGWSDCEDQLGLFDVIIGSDLLYEDEHVEQLSNFIVSHALERCEIVVVDPSRGRKTKFIKQLEKHGFSHTIQKVDQAHQVKDDYKGFVITFTR